MSEIATATTCNLCGQTFYGPKTALGGKLEPGDIVGPRFMQFIEKLMAHIAERHPEHYQVSQAKANEFQGWMLLSIYSSDDPEVLDQRNYFRWSTHQATLKARAENLDVRAGQIAAEFFSKHRIAYTCQQDGCPAAESTTLNGTPDDLTRALASTIEDVLKELRNFLEEPDAYTPVEPKQSGKTTLLT